MSLTVTVLVFAAALSAIAVLALVRALRQAEQGYEDETGFHTDGDSSAPRAS